MASLANNNNDKSYSLETFIEVHSGQLEAQNIPKKLWSKIYQKLFNNQFDANKVLVLDILLIAEIF